MGRAEGMMEKRSRNCNSRNRGEGVECWEGGAGKRPLGWQKALRLVDGVGRTGQQGLPGLGSCTFFRMQWEPLKAFEQNYLMGKSPWLSCAGWVGKQG